MSTIYIGLLVLAGQTGASANEAPDGPSTGVYERPSGLPNTADAIDGWLNG